MAKYNQFYSVLSAIKRCFSRSPVAKKALELAQCPYKTGPRGGARYCCKNCRPLDCNTCTLSLSAKDVQRDHVEPIVPIGTPSKDMTWDEIVERIFCSLDNLQVLCKECHKVKSKEENKARRKVAREQ